MLSFTVYELATGRLLRAMTMPDMDAAMLNIDPATEGTIEGWHNPLTSYRTPAGVVADIPPQPGDWAVFDHATGQWTDPRTPADIAAAQAAALAAWRAGASLSRRVFIKRARKAGLLTEADALIAAQGGLPAAFDALIAALPADEQSDARIDWSAATTIERMDPLLAALASSMGVTDAALDDLFGTPPA